MRITAGIMMLILGMTDMGTFIVALSEGGIHDYPLSFILFVIISAVFIITGGAFCLKRKYWKLCFASSLLLSLIMIFGFLFVSMTLYSFLSLGGILSLIFICLRKRGWQEQEFQG